MMWYFIYIIYIRELVSAIYFTIHRINYSQIVEKSIFYDQVTKQNQRKTGNTVKYIYVILIMNK